MKDRLREPIDLFGRSDQSDDKRSKLGLSQSRLASHQLAAELRGCRLEGVLRPSQVIRFDGLPGGRGVSEFEARNQAAHDLGCGRRRRRLLHEQRGVSCRVPAQDDSVLRRGPAPGRHPLDSVKLIVEWDQIDFRASSGGRGGCRRGRGSRSRGRRGRSGISRFWIACAAKERDRQRGRQEEV